MVNSDWTTFLFGVAIIMLLVVVLGLRRLVLKRMANRAIHDPLTGVYTPDFIQEVYHSELRRAERTGVPFSLALVALRQPVRGAPVTEPDGVAVAVAEWLQEHLRGSDYIGRLEDNRFVVILPETWEEDALSVADRIGAFQYKLSRNGDDAGLSCEVGIATWRPEAPDVWTGALQQLDLHAIVASN